MTGHTADTDRTCPDERTVTVQEAAEELNTTERTVRRWLSKGKLRGHYDGRAWVVYLSGQPDTKTGQRPDVSGQEDTVTGHGPDLSTLVQLVDRLQRDNQELAGRLGFYQAKLQEAEQKILALSPGPEPEQHREPWWKRWFTLSPA